MSRIAVFRPDDGRLDAAAETVRDLGHEALADPMLAVEPTGATPRRDADYAVLTSTTGVDLVADADWDSGDATICAIGATTAGALRDAGYDVAVVPEQYTSAGLVDALEEEVDGARVEVARSDHGSPVLLDGLEAAGAYVHETVLYRLVRPEGSGAAATAAAAGDLDAALFTSSLTVQHFLDAAAERGVEAAAVAGLNDAIVGAIGPPTAETAADRGVEVDVIPGVADYKALARAVDERLAAEA